MAVFIDFWPCLSSSDKLSCSIEVTLTSLSVGRLFGTLLAAVGWLFLLLKVMRDKKDCFE